MRRKCLQLNVQLLFYCGLWPARGREAPTPLYYWRRLYPRVQLVRQLYGLLFQVANIALAWGDLPRMLEYLVMVLVHSMALVKTGSVFRGVEDVRRLVATLERWSARGSAPPGEGRARLIETEVFAHNFTRFFLALMLPTFALNVIVLIVQGLLTHSIPFRHWLPYDYQSSPVFEVTLAVTTTLMWFDLSLILFTDLLFLALCIHLVGQFAVLNLKLERLREEVLRLRAHHRAAERTGREFPAKPRNIRLHPARRRDPRPLGADMESYLRGCVKHHVTLIRLTRQLGWVFRHVLSLQVLITVTCGIVTVYITTLAKKTDFKVTLTMFLIFGCYLEFLLYCWLGNKLTEESQLVQLAMYSCDWVDATHSFKRSMRIVITRTNRLLIVRAGGLPLSMRTFRSIYKAAYYIHMIATRILLGVKIARRS